jgi:aryl-alcohol dehydrogenase-like predicted oxidoreductase
MGLDPPLSRLGLGTWAFGRTGWGVQDDQDSRASILRAVEQGITWIDTAAVYGDGHSEQLVGGALRQLAEAERPLVFTKGGLRVDPSSGATFRDLRPLSLREECEASLRRLGLERIDLYQLHWPVQDVRIVEQAWATLGELREEGKIRWAGVSNFDVALLERCAAKRSIETAQFPLSLLNRDPARDLLPWARKHGTRALVYSPLESGLLSGRFSLERLMALPEGDWRPGREQFREPRLGRTLRLLERLEPIAASLTASLAEMAIAWTLAWPGVSGVVVGARSAEQVDGWARAANVTLDASTLEKIASALVDTGAGDGPTRPDGGHAAPTEPRPPLPSAPMPKRVDAAQRPLG